MTDAEREAISIILARIEKKLDAMIQQQKEQQS